MSGHSLPRCAACALLITLVACQRAPERGPTAEQIETARSRAEAATKALTGALLGRLRTALAEGSPTQAIDVCSREALEISARVAREQGVALRRTALRVRNPANAPDALERSILEGWLADARSIAPAHGVVPGDRGRELRYFHPILLGDFCVGCHGTPEEIGDEVLAALAQRYPDDRATGFRPGELRGAVSVRVALDAK